MKAITIRENMIDKNDKIIMKNLMHPLQPKYFYFLTWQNMMIKMKVIEQIKKQIAAIIPIEIPFATCSNVLKPLFAVSEFDSKLDFKLVI